VPSEPEYLELGVADGVKAQKFYSELLGWEFYDMGQGNGMTTNLAAPTGVHGSDSGRGFEVYFTVDDLAAAIARVAALGGTSGEVNTVREFGSYARCQDDQGTWFGLRELPKT
jgi:uncharacterized protein